MESPRFVTTRNKPHDYTVFWLDFQTGLKVPNKVTYRNIHGCSVVMKVKGQKVEFGWKDERAKTTPKVTTDNPVTSYGRMVSIRLAGYETAEVTSDCPGPAVAAVDSMLLPFEIITLGEAAATVSILVAVGDLPEARKVLEEIWPSVRDLEYCALTTVGIGQSPEFLPRSQWLEEVRSKMPWAQTGVEGYEQSRKGGGSQ